MIRDQDFNWGCFFIRLEQLESELLLNCSKEGPLQGKVMGTFETGLIQAAPPTRAFYCRLGQWAAIELLSHLARSASAVVRQVLLAWDPPTPLLRVGEALAAYSSLTEGIATASWVSWIRAVADDRQNWANHNTCADARYRVDGLGFASNLVLPTRKVSLGFKYFKQFANRSTFRGYSVQISGAITF